MVENMVWPADKTINCIAGAKFALSCTYQDVTTVTIATPPDLVYDNKISVAALSGTAVASGNVVTTRTLDTTNYGGKKLVWAITATEDAGAVTVRQVMVKVFKPGDEYIFDEEMVVAAGWKAALDVKFLGVVKVTGQSVKVYYTKKDITADIATGSALASGNVVTTPSLNTTNFSGKTAMVVITATLDGGPVWLKAIKLRVLRPGEEA